MSKYDTDLIGERFGILTALEKASFKSPNGKHAIWKCKCDCGKITYVTRSNLKQGHTKSCGCLRKKGAPRTVTLKDYQEQYKNDPHNIVPIAEQDNDILMHCNNCQNEFLINRKLARNSFRNCPFCDDGVSYPNKFLRNFIIQLPVDEYKFEYSDFWTKGKIYDAFFLYKEKKYVIEIDGEQHHRDAFYKTIESQEENDSLKDELAEQANYNMIRIDASTSSPEYIIDQIKSSLFNEIFDLSKIDWETCKQNSVKSLVILVCEYFNEHKCTGKDLADHFNLGKTTIHRYLEQGLKIGLLKSNYKQIMEQAIFRFYDFLNSSLFHNLLIVTF